MIPSTLDTPIARRRMPLRHKLMLLLACEILIVGFHRADPAARRTGIVIEVPAVPHHRIA